MKDLYVLTADADAMAVMKGVLKRHQSLGVREILFEVDRHVKRDSGMVKEGPEIVGLKHIKNNYKYVILMWDHDGSGRERDDIDLVQNDLTERLNQKTWSERCLTIAVQPELEEWLWHSPMAISKVFNVDMDVLNSWCKEYADKNGITVDVAYKNSPKEIFEHVIHCSEKRRPRPGDFEKIASVASLSQWQKSPSFQRIVHALRDWFPPA